MAVRGGIDSLRSPCGSPLTAMNLSNWLSPVVDPRVGFSSPRRADSTKKSPYFRTSSSLNMAVRGGLTRFARPRAARSLRSRSVQLAVASCRSPVGASRSPPVCAIYEKKPVLSYELFFKYGGEGGIELASLALRAARSLRSRSVQLAGVPSCRFPVGGLSHPPPARAIYEKKARTFVRALL